MKGKLFNQELAPQEIGALRTLNNELKIGIPENECGIDYNVERILNEAAVLTIDDLHHLGVSARCLDKVNLKVFRGDDKRFKLRIIKKESARRDVNPISASFIPDFY